MADIRRGFASYNSRIAGSFLTNFNRQNDLHGLFSLRANFSFGVSSALETKEVRRKLYE
jgi:hypothetical protein